MTTIHFKVDKLYGGYAPVLEFYNAHRPAGTELLCQAKVEEGGFEIKLNEAELKEHSDYLKDKGRLTDYNDTVRQLRFSTGARLRSGYYMGFTQTETELLFRALQHSLGANNVVLIDDINGSNFINCSNFVNGSNFINDIIAGNTIIEGNNDIIYNYKYNIIKY